MKPTSLAEITDAYLKGRLPILPSLRAKPSRPYIYQTSQDSLVAGAAATSIVTMDNDAHFLVEAIAAKTSGLTSVQDKVTVQVSDTTSGQPWSNQAVRLRDFAGFGLSPKKLSHPILLRPSTTLQAAWTSVASETLSIDLAFIGRKVYGVTEAEEVISKKRLWFQYVMPIVRTSTQRTDSTLNILNESDFILYELVSSMLWEQIVTNSGLVNLNMRDTSSDRSLSSGLVNACNIFGASAVEKVVTNGLYTIAGGGFKLPKPWPIKRNATVNFDVQNEASATQTFDLVLQGIRIFTPQSVIV